MRQVPLILASSSPRRVELLGRLGIVADAVDPADIDETPARGELPHLYARRMAREKAATVAPRHKGSVVLAADVVVAVGRRILPKAETEAEARECLALISGRRHKVHAAVAIVDADDRARDRLSTSILAFKRLSDTEIHAYVASGEWAGKAGGYAIQGRAEAWVRHLGGSFSGVMGLPLYETRALLAAAGIDIG